MKIMFGFSAETLFEAIKQLNNTLVSTPTILQYLFLILILIFRFNLAIHSIFTRIKITFYVQAYNNMIHQ